MKKYASRLRLKAFFFIYYDQVLNNLYIILFVWTEGIRIQLFFSWAYFIMEGGALVAGFFPLTWVIGGFFIGIYFHSARQRRSGQTKKKCFFKLFSYFWHTFVFIYWLIGPEQTIPILIMDKCVLLLRLCIRDMMSCL